MKDTTRINIFLLQSYKNNFDAYHIRFNNNSYNTFNSSYLKHCSDPYVMKMSKKLDELYKIIDKGYCNIDKWWSNYNSNVESLENYLSGNGQLGAITDSSVRNYIISNLTSLNDCNTLTKEVTFSQKEFDNYSLDDIYSWMGKFSSCMALANITPTVYSIITSIFNNNLIGAILTFIVINHSSDLTDTCIDSVHMLANGDIEGAITNILDELWTVDTGSTIAVGFNSVLTGISKFGIGLLQDLEDFFAISDSNSLSLFNNVSTIESNIKSNKNYSLSDDECNILIEYYYENEKEISNSTLNALIKYYKQKNKNNADIEEYEEILAILNNISNSEMTVESQKAKFSTIFRLNNQTAVDNAKIKFYNESFFGNVINDNSFIKYDNNIVNANEEVTENVLIYGTHISFNCFNGFMSALIPFSDAIFKPTEYNEGSYFSDEMGKEKHDLIAEISYTYGLIRGMMTEIGLDMMSGFGASKATSTTVKMIDNIDDGVKLTTKLKNTVKAFFNGMIPKNIDDVLDIFTGGLYKTIKSCIENTTDVVDVADDIVDGIAAGKKVTTFLNAADNIDDAVSTANNAKVINNISDTADEIGDIGKKITPDEAKEVLENFKKAFSDGSSDANVLDAVYKQFDKAISEGNEDALKMLNKLTDLKQRIPELKFKLYIPGKNVDINSVVSFYLPKDKSINILPRDLNINGLTNFHELGHVIDLNSGQTALPGYKSVFDSAEKHLSDDNYKLLNEFVDKYKDLQNGINSDANKAFSKMIKELGFDDFDSYRKALVNQYDELLKGSSDDIINYLNQSEISKYISGGKIDANVLADANIAATLNNFQTKFSKSYMEGMKAISDMIDATFSGKFRDSNFPGHGTEYYAKYANDYRESIANFSALKAGAQERLDDVKHFLGNDFFNFFEDVYNDLLK